MKHAFLIVAHHQFDILGKMISLLDDDDCDFYINIDGKTKENPEGYLSSCVSKSRIFFSHLDVYWGGYSQIACTLHLLKQATPLNYSYYHYMSGVDFPIKRKSEILSFFSNNNCYQFIHFERKTVQQKYVDRLRWHSFFQDTNSAFLHYIDKLIRNIEKLAKYDRTKKDNITYQYGTNWFSITNEFANYVINQEDWVNKTFQFTRCGDELFIQTLLVNSPYKNQLYNSGFNDDYTACLRFIDWKRGKPYVFRTEDYDELMSSQCLFARKFDKNIDSNIIEKLFQSLKEE